MYGKPTSKQVNEFIRIEERATEKGEAVFTDEGSPGTFLLGRRFAIEGELESSPYLCGRILPGIPAEALREEASLLEEEFAVEKIQRL
jgi:hypothetical protein